MKRKYFKPQTKLHTIHLRPLLEVSGDTDDMYSKCDNIGQYDFDEDEEVDQKCFY